MFQLIIFNSQFPQKCWLPFRDYSSELSCSWYNGMYGFGRGVGGAVSFLPSGYSSPQTPPPPHTPSQWMRVYIQACEHARAYTHTQVCEAEALYPIKTFLSPFGIPQLYQNEGGSLTTCFSMSGIYFQTYTLYRVYVPYDQRQAFCSSPRWEREDMAGYFKWS